MGPIGRHAVHGMHGPDGSHMLISPLISHDTDGFDGQKHGKRLPELGIKAGLFDFIHHNPVGFAEKLKPFFVRLSKQELSYVGQIVTRYSLNKKSEAVRFAISVQSELESVVMG